MFLLNHPLRCRGGREVPPGEGVAQGRGVEVGSGTGSGPWDALGSAQGEPGDGCWMLGHVHSPSVLTAASLVLGQRQLGAGEV